jgi:soluble lytic murein transglycosylase-like protein
VGLVIAGLVCVSGGFVTGAHASQAAPSSLSSCPVVNRALASMDGSQRERFALISSSCFNAVEAPAEPMSRPSESMHLQLFEGKRSSPLGGGAHRSVASIAQWQDLSPTLGSTAKRKPRNGAAERAIRLSPAIDAVARRHQIDPLLMHAIAHVESRHNPQARSHAGALGVMQIMPTTGQRFGVEQRGDLHHVPTNLEVSATYLKTLQERFGNNLTLVLAAYNAGEGAVEKYGRRIPPYPETQRYVTDVMATYHRLGAAARSSRGRSAASL